MSQPDDQQPEPRAHGGRAEIRYSDAALDRWHDQRIRQLLINAGLIVPRGADADAAGSGSGEPTP
jgi:hypothetical protein